MDNGFASGNFAVFGRVREVSGVILNEKKLEGLNNRSWRISFL